MTNLTSHELAHILLEQRDLPVILCIDNETTELAGHITSEDVSEEQYVVDDMKMGELSIASPDPDLEVDIVDEDLERAIIISASI